MVSGSLWRLTGLAAVPPSRIERLKTKAYRLARQKPIKTKAQDSRQRRHKTQDEDTRQKLIKTKARIAKDIPAFCRRQVYHIHTALVPLFAFCRTMLVYM